MFNEGRNKNCSQNIQVEPSFSNFEWIIHLYIIWTLLLQLRVNYSSIYNLNPPSLTLSELFIYIWFESSFSNFEWIIYLYIYFACQFVCLFESNKRQNGWTDRDYFLLDLTWPQERLMNDQKLYSDKIRFTLNFENPRNSFMTSANFFWSCFTMYSIEIEDGREVP